MATLRNLVVKVTGDTSGLQQSLGDAQAKTAWAFNSMQKGGLKFNSVMSMVFNKFSSAAMSATGSMSGIAAAFGPVGLAAGAAVLALGAITDGIKNTIKYYEAWGDAAVNLARTTMPLYKEASENESKLATIMRQRMGATNAMVASAKELANVEQATGVTEGDAVIAGQQQLATFLHQYDALKLLTPALADLVAQIKGTSASSGDFVTIGNLLGKAMEGNTTSLKRYGISFTDAQAAMLKVGTEMDRAALLAQIVNQNIGNMNQVMGNTPIGRIAQMSNAWGDLKEKVGQVFTTLVAAATPAIIQFIALMSKAVNAYLAFAHVIAALVGVQSEQVETSKNVASAGGKLAKSQDKVAKATGGAAKAAKKWIAAFDQINKIQKEAAGGGSTAVVLDAEDLEIGIGEASAAIGEDVQDLIDNIKTNFNGLKTAWNTFWSGSWMPEPIRNAWATVKGIWAQSGPWFSSVSNNVGTAFSNLPATIGGFFSNAWARAKEAFNGAYSFFYDVGYNKIGPAIAGVPGLFQSTFGAAYANATNAFASLQGWASELPGRISVGISGLPGAFQSTFGTAYAHMVNAFAGATSFFTTLRETILSKFTTIGSSIGTAVGNSFKSIVNNIFTTMENILNTFVGRINSAIGIVNRFPGIPDIPYISQFHLPRLAEGGIANSPTLAEIGHGQEAVIPLEQNTGWMDTFASKLGAKLAMAGGPNPTFNLMLDGYVFDTFIYNAQQGKLVRGNGR